MMYIHCMWFSSTSTKDSYQQNCSDQEPSNFTENGCLKLRDLFHGGRENSSKKHQVKLLGLCKINNSPHLSSISRCSAIVLCSPAQRLLSDSQVALSKHSSGKIFHQLLPWASTSFTSSFLSFFPSFVPLLRLVSLRKFYYKLWS